MLTTGHTYPRMVVGDVQTSITKRTPCIRINIRDLQSYSNFGNKGCRFHAGAARRYGSKKSSASNGGFWEQGYASKNGSVAELFLAASIVQPLGQGVLLAEKSSDDMSWDEVQVWSAECGVRRVQYEIWGKCLFGVALRRGRAQVIFLNNNVATASRKAENLDDIWEEMK